MTTACFRTEKTESFFCHMLSYISNRKACIQLCFNYGFLKNDRAQVIHQNKVHAKQTPNISQSVSGYGPFSHHIIGPVRFPLTHPSGQQVLLLSHKLKNEPQNILDTGSAVHEVLYSVRNRPLHQLTNMIRTKSNKSSPQHTERLIQLV